MAATKTPIATDSAAELNPLIGDDTTATFEDDPKFIDSNPTDGASSENVEVQRDTDDSEDSDEEEDELEDDEDDELIEEDDDEDVEDEDDDLDEDEEDEDEDEEDADDEDEVGAAAQHAASLTSVRGTSPEKNEANAMEEDDDIGDEEDTLDAQEEGSDTLEKDRAIDAALRMSALVAVTAELAANL